MRKYKLALAAAAAVASVGALAPATTAGAHTMPASHTAETAATAAATPGTEVRDVSARDLDCEDTIDRYGDTGTVNMYDRRQCKGAAMCKDYDNDSNYGSGGACKGGDNNDTSSAANLAWNTRNDGVYFYSGYYKSSGERTIIGCIKRGQAWGQLDWADADNAVSSHQWGQC